MKIKFGTTSNNVLRAGTLGLILAIGFGYFTFEIQHVLDNSHESCLRSSMSNVSSIKIRFFCGIPYDDCRCSVQSTKNEHLKYCLTDNFLMVSRIFPLVSFILQISLIRDLFTLSAKYIRFIVYSLWIITVFIFFIIANGIYRDSCFHRYINAFFGSTGVFWYAVVFYDILYRRDIKRSSHNDYNTSNDQNLEEVNNDSSDNDSDQTLEEVDNEPIFWRDLI